MTTLKIIDPTLSSYDLEDDQQRLKNEISIRILRGVANGYNGKHVEKFSKMEDKYSSIKVIRTNLTFTARKRHRRGVKKLLLTTNLRRRTLHII